MTRFVYLGYLKVAGTKSDMHTCRRRRAKEGPLRGQALYTHRFPLPILTIPILIVSRVESFVRDFLTF